MPFFTDPYAKVRTETLIRRMIALKQAIEAKKISINDLEEISRLSTQALQTKSNDLVSNSLDNSVPINAPLKALYEILSSAEEVTINNDKPLIDGLKGFDSEHGEYLDLSSLAVDHSQTLSLNLNDFATFYNVFIKYMSYKKEAGELGDEYTLNFDSLAAKTNWLKWQHSRPERVSFDPTQAGQPGLFEKFLARNIRKNEWLTDLDIKRQLTILGLQEQTYIVPLKEDTIGLILHFEREKHPKGPYVIPFIVNLGEDNHSQIDSRGIHWTRMLVTVDPTNSPPEITVDYTDDLFLHESSKKDIKETITKALKYRTQLGGYTKGEPLKIYTAFPECNEPTINITGSGEQKDGFTCGYRALKGIVSDLIAKDVIQNNETYQKFLDCNDSTSLRDYVYRSLLGEHHITEEIRSRIEKVLPKAHIFESTTTNSTEFAVRPSLVEGQMLELSNPPMMKKGKKAPLDSQVLENLFIMGKKLASLRELEVIKGIAAASEKEFALNLQEILDREEIKSYDPALVLQVIFEQVGKNTNITHLKLAGTDKIDEQLLHEKIDSLPLNLKLSSEGEEPNLKQYLSIINARNKLLYARDVKIHEGADLWDSLFENMLFTLPLIPSGSRFEWMRQYLSTSTQAVAELGGIGFKKLLQYTADHQGRFMDQEFPLEEFTMRHDHGDVELMPDVGFELLVALKEHLQSEESFTPFKRFHFTISNFDPEDLVDELTSILAAMQPGQIEKIEIETDSLAKLSEKTIQTLIDILKDKGYPTILSFSASKETISSNLLLKLQELENIGLDKRRQGLAQTAVQSNQPNTAKTQEPIVLGKIGKAILQAESVGNLDVEIQIQEQQQQQQQVQQQIQSSLGDEELPEEDEIRDEAFLPFTDDEELLTRPIFVRMTKFIVERHPELSSNKCWDLITGEHSEYFKYGIKKMTVSAAKMLIEHLQDVQYGLHPDNLPRGFSLQEDENKDVVLTYTSLNPTLNVNESPLTIRFSKPLAPNQWSGNTLQFMSRVQADRLYQSVIGKKDPKPTLEDCISQFFFLRSDTITVKNQTITLTDAQRVGILIGFIEGMTNPEEASAIQKQIRDIFGDKLTSSNIKALGEVLYEQGPQGLSGLLDALNQIKKTKGEAFFASFKTCFIDPSQNLNELTTERARAAMQKLLTLSSAQTTWWTSLTEQHTSNLRYQTKPSPGQRWANLADLTEGFLYFCGQLEEVSPNLNLTEYCPLSGVADMRVGLDRLLTTILPNAHDVDEQFYEGLEGLSLDPLGPFYASRYEGYKLVKPDMLLDLGNSYDRKPEVNQQYCQSGFCFKCDKIRLLPSLGLISTNTREKKLSILMRYIATFNHRAPQREYIDAFNKIMSIQDTGEPENKNNLLFLLAAFGTGKRGKNFTPDDVDNLVKWFEQSQKDPEKSPYLVNLLLIWAGMIEFPIRPTIAEIVEISKLAIAAEEPGKFVNNLSNLAYRYGTHAEGYLEALLLLAKNKKNLGADNFQSILGQIEGMNKPQDPMSAVSDFDSIDLKTRVATAKLLAVCNSESVDASTALEKTRVLYTAVSKCLDAHGAQTVSDLLELLGHIDVERSEELPSLDTLINLITSVAANNKPSYNELERIVKSALPATCVIQTEKVMAKPVEPAGNLQTILAKHMSKVIEQLEPKKVLIDSKLGEGFFASLSTPEGPKKLLDNLKKIAKFSGIIGDVARSELRNVMMTVYDSVMAEGIEHIGIKGESNKGLLVKVINNKVNHLLKEKSEFSEFVNLYAGELESLNQFLGSLQTINKNWPADIRDVLTILDESPHLNAYPLSLLAKITGALVNNFNKNLPFPAELLREFLVFKNLDEDTVAALKGIIEIIFDKDKKDAFNDSEKRLLCELALRYCHDTNNPSGAPGYIEKLLPLREADSALFTARLKLLLSSFEKINNQSLQKMNDVFAVINQLQDPDLVPTVLNFFTENKNQAKNFLSVIDNLAKIDKDKQSLVLAIALQAAQASADDEQQPQDQVLPQVIDELGKLDLKSLQQLGALYRSPKHPNLSSLNGLLADNSLKSEEGLTRLQANYDRDYWLDKNKHRDFNTRQLAKYLDNLQDMNYERPLLLSQREELQKWFLYINAIGNKRGVPTQPWTNDGGLCKPFQEMSHDEIQGLLKYYRAQLKDTNLSPEQRLKMKLETIALLREAMYRGTGNFPRATQILYLLTAMQQGQDFIAQIQTGQGKSLTAGLAAAMANIEGKTVDVCTSSLFLAHEGLEENQGFFEYLGITAKLIHANSGKDEYEEGAIHYSSMPEMALYRSKMELLGKVFPDPEDCTLIADEVDFSTLDDSTRYRYAASLDPVTDPYKSAYTWIYEALVTFVDNQAETKSTKTDEEFLEQAKLCLRNAAAAKTKEERTQLKNLEEQPEVYKKRLETWLIAAGKTKQIVERKQAPFRVVTLQHEKFGQISKACILTGGRPNIQAEFSDGIQQFLHVRLRQKHRSQIDQGTMPDFLVEPEKTYITTLNSKILFNTYKQRLGMSGTAGSKSEIKEQYAKYGFRFVDIPPFTESRRQDLKPILTNPKLVNNPEAESRDHINRIVKDALRHLSQYKGEMAWPLLIHCRDKEEGEKIYQALKEAIEKNPGKYQSKFQGINNGIQRFYSSEKPTPEERNKEEQETKEKARQDGMITISTVFGRGTDIKPATGKGLYTIDTFVDTEPYSSEDLERSKRQKIGRAGRAGQEGFTRLIIRRSEFADVYSPKQMKKIPDTIEGLDEAISNLNQVRNEKRVVERELRESFDDVKDIIYQEFFKYIQAINTSGEQVPKKAIRDKLTKQWNLLLTTIDDRWDEIQHDSSSQGNMTQNLNKIAQFACAQWNDLAKDGGELQTALTGWAKYNKLAITMPKLEPLNAQKVVRTIVSRRAPLEQFYVKRSQRYGKVDSAMLEAAVYTDFMSSSKTLASTQAQVALAKTEAMQAYINIQFEWLSTPAHQQKLRGKFNITHDSSENNVREIMGALLYLRYKAYRDGNPLAYARLSQECQRFQKQILWSKGEKLITALVQAQQAHFNLLTNHRGEHEAQKGKYLRILMSEARKLLPEETIAWKKAIFTTWWNGDNTKEPLGMKAQTMDWLTTYKNKWWTRLPVSGDRKKVVAGLLTELGNAQSPQDILKAIADARQQLLVNDRTHSRSLQSSMQGRLYQYLDELELKIQAAMPPDELDNNTDLVFLNIKNVLQTVLVAGKKVTYPGLSEVIAILNNQNKTPGEKYQALSVFFNNMLLMDKPKGADKEDWQVLQAYCRQTKLQMVRYFDQCGTNSSLNERRSVQVYQAASEAAAAHFQRILEWEVKPRLNIPNKDFNYHGKTINFEPINLDILNQGVNSSIFMKVNQAPIYAELLSSLEKSIVENSPGNTQVQFKKITLDFSEYYENGFQLAVDMRIDGVPAQIIYHIDMQTGEMYCNDTGLQKLNEPRPQEPELGEFTYDRELEEIEQTWKVLENTGEGLTTEIQRKEALEKLRKHMQQIKDSVGSNTPIEGEQRQEILGLSK